jgi:Tfp pilus assembly protein PilF
MKRLSLWMTVVVFVVVVVIPLWGQESTNTVEERLWQLRNLGKAFYENPTTQYQAVDEFKKALDLAPTSARERLNYGLALLRVGKTAQGVAELEKVQKQDPRLPHTWFNLAIAYKRDGKHERAIEQFKQMVALAPNEPISHYNLGVLYKLTGKPDVALQHFEMAAKLDPSLAGPRFQLYNAYRALGRAEDAQRELQIFQEIKKRQAGAAIPEDLEWSNYAEIYDPIGPRPAEAPPKAELQFENHVLATNFGPENVGLAALEADGDGVPDLLVWSATQVRLYKGGTTLVENSGLADVKQVISIAPGDFNNDGLADLCVLTEAGAVLYANQKGQFQTQPVTLPAGRFAKAVWLDFDHDYDVDLFLLGEKSALARNNGAAGFGDQTAAVPFVAGRAIDGVSFDSTKDTNGMDLIVTYQDRPAILYRDRLGGKYEAVPLEEVAAGTKGTVAYDSDNDGWTDLAATADAGVALWRNKEGRLEKLSPFSATGPVLFADLERRGIGDAVVGDVVYHNLGKGRFTAGKTVGSGGAIVASVGADFDADGREDLAGVTADGSLRLFKNITATDNRWILVSLTGVKNLKLAPGAEVEVKAGPSYQKKLYQGLPLMFGLGAAAQADAIRITWPNGLIQNEVRELAGKALAYKEKPRLSGSCPMIFTWNGERFEFITDVLGVAPLGASAGDGTYFPVDHDEYVQIPGQSLALVNDHYEIRITEELREVAYIDQVQLIAVDHLMNVDVFTNDKFKGPPFPEFRLFGVSQRLYPQRARDDEGRDVLDRIIKRDRAYPDGFRRDYSGVAELHSIELDFGPQAAPDNRAVLVLTGWVDWADGSTFLQAAQEQRGGLVMPYVQVKDAQGQWQTVIEDMGMPAGKPKTIVVDLTGKFLSASRAVRIVTNLCLYWDEIFLSQETGEPDVKLTRTDANLAELRFGGFSTPIIHPERKQPEIFDYSRRTPTSMWNPTPGLYTRYGDVGELLKATDDRLVIMGSGDELRLLFSAAGLPRLKEGCQRDFLLLVDGWAKDADLNTAFGQTVEPLPFHGMSGYPYSDQEKFPEDATHRSYRERYNTRPALRLLRPFNEPGTH